MDLVDERTQAAGQASGFCDCHAVPVVPGRGWPNCSLREDGQEFTAGKK